MAYLKNIRRIGNKVYLDVEVGEMGRPVFSMIIDVEKREIESHTAQKGHYRFFYIHTFNFIMRQIDEGKELPETHTFAWH